MKTHCTSHCAACGSHFHSTTAFDKHRQFEEGHKGDWNHRVCIEPADDSWFEALTADGVCDIYPSQVRDGATIWTGAAGLERARAMRISTERDSAR